MIPEESATEFRKFLRANGHVQKSLTVTDACKLMFDFYQEIRPTGTSPKMGDGIVYAYGIKGRGGRKPYEITLIRLFTSNDDQPAPNGSRLRLSIGFNWLTSVGWFNQPDRGLPHGNSRYAWNVESAATLYEELQRDTVYQVLQDHAPEFIQLRHESTWDLFG